MRPTAAGGRPPLLVGRSRERDLTHARLRAALAGHCCDRAEPPDGPWVALLEQARALPDRSPAPPAVVRSSVTRSSGRAALFGELRRCCVAVARARPVVILRDDLQWADDASLDLPRGVARPQPAVEARRRRRLLRDHASEEE